MEPDLLAIVEFLSTEAGGRESETPSMRVGCILVFNSESIDCSLLLKDHEPIAPGETALVPIKLLDPKTQLHRFKIGTRFDLRDTRVFAHGIVTEIRTQPTA